MKICGNKPIRRIMIRALLIMALLWGAAGPGWGTGPLPDASGQPYSAPYSTSAVFSKNNAPAGLKQEDRTGAAAAAPAPAAKRAVLAQRSAPSQAPGVSAVPEVKNTALSATESGSAPEQKSPKMVYLTFDDGPSAITPKVLDILREQKIKATFFVLGEQARTRPELINALWEQGHAIGNHTYNHNYSDLYSGFTRFWTQIKQTEEVLREITGSRPQLVRAPGGTYGHFDAAYFSLMKQAGYTVMDWTVDSGDSRRRGVPAADIVRDSLEGLGDSEVILLLHDGGGHEESVKALPEIIRRYKAAGYSFGVLDNSVRQVVFRVSSSAEKLQRAQPPAAWVAANIVPNAALFASGKPLVLEVGLQEARLEAGEYLVEQGRYLVPLRAVIERLGGDVSWDAATRSGRVVWNGRSLTADAQNRRFTATLKAGTGKEGFRKEGAGEVRAADIRLIGSTLWVPLRELLEMSGHPLRQAGVTAEERRVKAL
ncbi:polysaccharide deacetylase [Paenibacillus tepidiphilus]|uniref:polysaccharide deacetylase n=1 Tax=Paenibacillus tepidiphilus TaxID=2608683 RepID=UPI001EF13502|nr:polysaccharide deacetylase [Paenibacillus tepidiphilus]